jgi:hypothetical protein
MPVAELVEYLHENTVGLSVVKIMPQGLYSIRGLVDIKLKVTERQILIASSYWYSLRASFASSKVLNNRGFSYCDSMVLEVTALS